MVALGIDVDRCEELERTDAAFRAWRDQLTPCPAWANGRSMRAIDEGLQRWQLETYATVGHRRVTRLIEGETFAHVVQRWLVTPPADPSWLVVLEDKP